MKTEALRKQLTDWLRDTARLDEVRKWPAVSDQPHPPRFMVGDPCQLTGDGHHTMRADAFVLDETLGSIGVVHCLGSDVVEVLKQRLETSNPSLSGFIRQSIEEAVYLRHLMGMKVDASHLEVDPSKIGRLLPSVELVFVVPEQPKNAKGGALTEVRDRLIEMKRETALLHAIGINLVVAAEDPTQDSDSFDRGFAWLLRHTMRWWGSRKEESKSSLPPVECKKWSSLTTKNFRIRVQRTWAKSPRKNPQSAGFHVVHGPNGSGKSSLAEAFEFAVTGRSSRVRDGKWESMVFRDPNLKEQFEASVGLDFDGSEQDLNLPVGPPPRGEKPADVLSDGALRFDEAVGNKLVKADGEERMSLWLRAYFSHVVPELEASSNSSTQGPGTAVSSAKESPVSLKDAAEQIRQAYRELRPRSEGNAASEPEVTDAMIDGLMERLRRLEKGDGSAAGFDWGGLLKDPELGFESQWLDLVAEYDPEITTLLAAGGDKAKQGVRRLLERADRLTKAAADFLDVPLAEALERFEEVARLQTATAEEYNAEYGKWLNCVARTDLAVQAIHLRVSLPLIAESSNDPLRRFLNESVSMEELVEVHKAAAAARDESRDWLASHAVTEATLAASTTLSSPQFQEGDMAQWIKANSEGVFGALNPGGVDGARRIVMENKSKRGWTQPFSNRLKELKTMRTWMESRSWSAEAEDSTWSDRRFNALGRLVGAFESRRNVIRKEALALQKITPHLGAALKEMLELMTPASWAYKPLEVKVDWKRDATANPGRTRSALDVTARGMELQDVLNTAELNTAALAMHLLCAPLARNPYRVTFLDDPLQNMDELTVTTVARAMAKLIRLMSQTGFQEWDLVMLLHGADDCERMIQEAPAVFYRLPWSSPEQGQGDRKESIEAEPGVGEAGSELFDFVEFLGLRGA